MASANKPLVLVLGATGRTGGSIIDGLLASGTVRIAAAVRGSSLFKPETGKLRDSGVEIREGDVTDNAEKLCTMLQGVDVLISAVTGWLLEAQKGVFLAAKEAGVQRIIPCDFGTPGKKGVRPLHDGKLAIRDWILEHDIPYTFIDVGWWMQLFLPHSIHSTAPQTVKENTWQLLDDADPLMLVTNLDHIGTYVARVIVDPRTLNQTVIIWEDQVILRESHEIGERVSGEGAELKARRIYLHKDDIVKMVATAEENLKQNPNDLPALIGASHTKYLLSMYVLEENTLANAKQLGYLDAKELYPDIKPYGLEDYAKEFYAQGGDYYYK